MSTKGQNDGQGSPERPITVVRAGAGGEHSAQFERIGIVAIGFGLAESLAGLSREQVIDALSRRLPNGPTRRLLQNAGQLYRFAHDVQSHDIVVTPESGSRELIVGEVTSPYEFWPQGAINGDYHHVHRVNWFARRSRDLLSQPTLYSIGSIATVFQPRAQAQAELRALIRDQPSLGPVAPSGSDDDTPDDLIGDQEARSAELIKSRLARLDDNDMEKLVAGILRAMGYHTQVAPESGGDGGVDVPAARDPLFVSPPVIKVQVKQRAGKAEPSAIRALAGVLHADERGIFVSMGGFTGRMQDNQAAARITLIDAARLQQLFLEYYDQLDQDTKALIPLRRVYSPREL